MLATTRSALARARARTRLRCPAWIAPMVGTNADALAARRQRAPRAAQVDDARGRAHRRADARRRPRARALSRTPASPGKRRALTSAT